MALGGQDSAEHGLIDAPGDGPLRSAPTHRWTSSAYARYVGRVGALAVALGVTGAMATTPGVAWADDTPSSSTSSDAPGTDNGPSAQDQSTPASTTSTPTSRASDSTPKATVAEPSNEPVGGHGVSSGSETVTTHDSGVIVRSSGGALTSGLHAAESDTTEASADDGADADDVESDEETTAESGGDEPGKPPTQSEDVEETGDQPTVEGSDQTPPAATASDAPVNESSTSSAPANTKHDETEDLSAETNPTAVGSAIGLTAAQAPPSDDGGGSVLLAAAATPAAAAPAPFSWPQLPSPAHVIDQIRDTLTATLTRCACALVSGVQSLITSLTSSQAQGTSAPAAPAEAPILWTVMAWVRRQADYALAAFNRTPVGHFVHQVTQQVVDAINDFGNSPLGRQLSTRVNQFFLQCDGSTALPTEFDRTTVVSGLSEPTDFAILTDADDPDEIHRIFITEKSGALKSYDPHTGQLTTLVSVPVVTADGERGLIGIEVDPHFWSRGQEGYHTIYIAYTGADNYDRLSSLLVNETLDGAQETVLIRSDQPAAEFHHGGELAFDPQGQNLYWAVGNNTNNANSQDLSTIHGKILRLKRDGTAAAGNPFAGDPEADPRVYALGFRNPFRFTFTPDGKLLVGDVGESSWEELNLVVARGNYGWPNAEGACDGCEYVNPIYAYPHDGLSNSGSITSVVVYTGDTFPAEYQNKVFIADYSLGWIKELTFDSEYSSLISEKTFDSGAGPVVKLAQGPDGNLYQLNIYPGTLSVIAPSGGDRAPTAVITASATSGAGSSLDVAFSAGNSSDPDDGDTLSYSWDFGGGRTSSDVNPTITFTNTSASYTAYQVTLTVTDGEKQSVATQRIVVGSTPPSTSITVDKNKYDAGDSISFSATASDAEDGQLPDSAYRWRVEFHHADHQHPFRDNITGPDGSITIPRNTDQLSNTFYRIVLTVTDGSGLSTTRSVDVTPNVVTLTFGANANATYTIDGIPHQGSHTEQAVVGVERTLNAPSPQFVGGQRLEFGSWSDSGLQSHVIVTPGTNTNYQATFVVVPSAAAVLA